MSDRDDSIGSRLTRTAVGLSAAGGVSVPTAAFACGNVMRNDVPSYWTVLLVGMILASVVTGCALYIDHIREESMTRMRRVILTFSIFLLAALASSLYWEMLPKQTIEHHHVSPEIKEKIEF